MDIKDYIASGVVELYALGALPDTEKPEFEQKVLKHPELARELSQVQQAIGGYAAVHALNPRPSLRADILESVLENEISPKEKLKHTRSAKNHSLTYKYLIAASLAALVISTFASWFFYSRWEDTEDRFSLLLSEKNQLAQNYNLVQDSFDKTLYDILVMRDEHAQVITLQATDTGKTYMARIYWNKLSTELFIDVLNLPEPAQDQQYHLWAFVKGKATDAGIFDSHEFSGVQRMKEILFADFWGVTLEQKDGTPAPAPDQRALILKNIERR